MGKQSLVGEAVLSQKVKLKEFRMRRRKERAAAQQHTLNLPPLPRQSRGNTILLFFPHLFSIQMNEMVLWFPIPTPLGGRQPPTTIIGPGLDWKHALLHDLLNWQNKRKGRKSKRTLLRKVVMNCKIWEIKINILRNFWLDEFARYGECVESIALTTHHPPPLTLVLFFYQTLVILPKPFAKHVRFFYN